MQARPDVRAELRERQPRAVGVEHQDVADVLERRLGLVDEPGVEGGELLHEVSSKVIRVLNVSRGSGREEIYLDVLVDSRYDAAQ